MTSRWEVKLPGSSLTLMFLLAHTWTKILPHTHTHTHCGGSSWTVIPNITHWTLFTPLRYLPPHIFISDINVLFLLSPHLKHDTLQGSCLFMSFSIYALLWPPHFNFLHKQCVLTVGALSLAPNRSRNLVVTLVMAEKPAKIPSHAQQTKSLLVCIWSTNQ